MILETTCQNQHSTMITPKERFLQLGINAYVEEKKFMQ